MNDRAIHTLVSKLTMSSKAGQRWSIIVSIYSVGLVRLLIYYSIDLNPEWDQIIYIPGTCTHPSEIRNIGLSYILIIL